MESPNLMLTGSIIRRAIFTCAVLMISSASSAQQYDNRESAIAPFEAAILATGQDELPNELMTRSNDVFSPWWSQTQREQMQPTSYAVPVSLETLIVSALNNSAQVKVYSDIPLIRETSITEADATFDWHAFMETRWNDLSEPVGNRLTTGGPSRFRDHHWTYGAGARRKNTLGGQFEIAQQFGHQSNNPIFLEPDNQGTARLTFSYTQPMLQGAGKVYNTSLTLLAAIDTKIAQDEFVRQLQSHLQQITEAYWTLHLERGALLQKKRVYERAMSTLQEVEGRQPIDAVESQVVRIRAAFTERGAELVRAYTAVRNAQERIHALVNDPNMATVESIELIPTDVPTQASVPVDMHTALSTALRNRPEIGQAIQRIKSSGIRLNMAKNELLPRLDAVLETYLSGLRGNSGVAEAWGRQFSEGEPGYTVGLQYNIPIGRRAPKARLQRRRLELRQLEHQFQATVESLMAEVKIAVREVSTSFREAHAKYESMLAAERQLEFIQERWKRLPGEDRTVGLYLEDLLKAQERLAEKEFSFLEAQTSYNLSLNNLKRATGTLLQSEQIVQGRMCDCNLPRNVLEKASIEQFFDMAPTPIPNPTEPAAIPDRNPAPLETPSPTLPPNAAQRETLEELIPTTTSVRKTNTSLLDYSRQFAADRIATRDQRQVSGIPTEEGRTEADLGGVERIRDSVERYLK